MSPLQSALAPAADQAQAIYGVWRLMLWICIPMYVLVLLGVTAVVWRMWQITPRAAPGDAQIARGLNAWVALIVAGLIALTLASFIVDRRLLAGPRADVNLRITGKQWWWQVDYLSDDPAQQFTTANELHLPLGKTAHIELRSGDVIHSFWVPNLSGKRDLIPGRVNGIELTPRQIGAFRGQCAEFCGLQHAHMALLVFVEDEATFASWRRHEVGSRESSLSATAQQGERIFVSGACAMCHTVRGTTAASNAGPDLTHLASRHTLAAGARPLNAASLAAWLADPQHLKPGANMPEIDLEPDQLNALVAYLLSLQ